MTSIAAARHLPEPGEQPERRVREQIDANSQMVAAAHEAYLHDAINSVSWERRGALQRLTRRP